LISLKEQVHAALEGICAHVVYGWNRDEALQEMICWRESANRRHAQADGREYLAELNYTLDIFAPCPEAAAELLAAADEKMCNLGLRREAAAEQFEQEWSVSHVNARYRALADAEGNIYQ